MPRTGTIELQSAGGSPFEPIEFPAGRSEHAVTRTLPAERSK
ncbi:MAG TPA: hypothetical protein VFZ65_05480 [Planctomycetota bacterium]|nr:hypothetical protein [Planctomycetota bacterium]